VAPEGEPTTVSDVSLVFRQRFWATSFRLLTAESESSPATATLLPADDGVCEFCGVYRNEPDQRHRPRSAIHYGTLTMRIPSGGPDRLSGSYWIDRRTTGDIMVRRIGDKHVGSHGAGLELLGQ
jgi:SMODS-associating 2TM, beta-strand rich effector domain